jgi:hypothetical protein
MGISERDSPVPESKKKKTVKMYRQIFEDARTQGVPQAVQCLLCKCEALSQIAVTPRKKTLRVLIKF